MRRSSRPPVRRSEVRFFPAGGRPLAALLPCWPLLGAAPASAANVVLLLMDDATATDVSAMPTVQQIARQGTTFDHSYVATPMCGPSRAVFHSGQYSQNNGERQNGYAQFVSSGAVNRTFAVALNKAGVDTSFVGKWMNDGPSSVLGWDNFTLQRSGGGGEGGAKGYYDYTLGGKAYGHAPSDYSVDVERDALLQDIKAARGRFLAMLAPHAPHSPGTPPQHYAGSGRRAGALRAADNAVAAIVKQLKADG